MPKPQIQLLYELLQDSQPHRTDEIQIKVYGGSHCGLARVGARIWDLKQKGHDIIGYKDKDNPTLYWYQLVAPAIIHPTQVFPPKRLFDFPDPLTKKT